MTASETAFGRPASGQKDLNRPASGQKSPPRNRNTFPEEGHTREPSSDLSVELKRKLRALGGRVHVHAEKCCAPQQNICFFIKLLTPLSHCHCSIYEAENAATSRCPLRIASGALPSLFALPSLLPFAGSAPESVWRFRVDGLEVGVSGFMLRVWSLRLRG